MASYLPRAESRKGFSIPDFIKDVREGRPETFMKRMESLIASIPYNEKALLKITFRTRSICFSL